jgi:hypothetical protein
VRPARRDLRRHRRPAPEPDRVRDLAEEIWTASSGLLPPVRAVGDPRSSRAGASAQSAYRRRREQDRATWRPGWAWRGWAVAAAALAVGLLIGLTVGAWLGWPMAMAAAVLAWSRLRFRPSSEAAIWKRQAAMERRTAAVLRPLGEEGYLVLHDITLPGWLDSVDHLVIGPTGVWVVASWRCRRLLPGGEPPPAIVRGLARADRRRGRGPRRPGLGPGPGTVVRAPPLVGPAPGRRRPPGGGPRPAPRRRPRRPPGPIRRPGAGHQLPARGPATGGLR